MRRLLLSFLLALVVVPAVYATPLAPFIDLEEQGLTLDSDGTGLATWPGGGVTLDVTTGGAVRFALLYWSGIDTACVQSGGNCTFPQPFGDQQVVFNGTPLTGTLIGTEQQQLAAINHLGYFADVTSIVSAAGLGPHSFTFVDGNLSNNLDVRSGVSLIVGFTNASDLAQYRVLIQDNLDFAWALDADAGTESKTVAPVVFSHGTLSTTRPADLLIIAGEGEAVKTDSLVISNNATVANSLDASSGTAWDHDLRTITIPAATSSTSVQLVSPSGDPVAEDFAWEVAVLRVAVGDVTAPTCSSVTVAGPPKRFDITIQDTESGIAEILVLQSQNADTVVPAFAVGTTTPILVTSTKINQALPMIIEIRTTDDDGNVTTCRFSDENVADLSIAKSASTTAIVAGTPFAYTIVVTNQGPGTATGVVVTDPLPSGTSAASSSSTVGTCSGTTTVTCNVGTLANGASATITINVTGTPATTGVMTNTATVTSTTTDPDPTDDSDSADITVTPNQADLSITKSASTSSITAGATFSYTIVVTNQGPAPATGVVVTDPLPSGITATSATSTVGTCSGTTTVTCNVGTLLNGASATITINASGSPSTAGVMTNTASVTAAQTDPDPADNSGSAAITVAADLSTIPALDARGLALLAMFIAAAAVLVMRRM
jgi:uncharacterized repeat protein (TIGR01451 family)